MRHFLDINKIDKKELRKILRVAEKCKGNSRNKTLNSKTLSGYKLVMIFRCPSTRTRVSFYFAMRELGGDAIVLDEADSQLSRGELISDAARVFSRYGDIMMLRCDNEEELLETAAAADIPVINGLTSSSHPCQIMSDIMTFEERLGSIEGKTIGWVGDGNNMALSWMQAADKFRFRLRLAVPDVCIPWALIKKNNLEDSRWISFYKGPQEAVEGAHAVVTDSWISMSDKDDTKCRLLSGYQVDQRLMSFANKEALFMHCLPAHRGQEVVNEVIDGPQSVVWDEAENRLHVQKSILAWCLRKI